MEKEDFERLKKVCEKEGFELIKIPFNDHELIVTKKKDIWEGVEFVENVLGVIKKVDHFNDNFIGFSDKSWAYKSLSKPSSEQAYVVQLTEEVHQRFGEIKAGDIFDRASIEEFWGKSGVSEEEDELEFDYDKDLDTFYIGGLGIYRKGKWAVKVKSKITVEVDNCGSIWGKPTSFRVVFDLGEELKDIKFDYDSASEFLASKLEEYLND